MKEKQFYVYLLASDKNGTIYVGVTSDLAGRAWQHKNKVIEGFTSKHEVTKLVWFESHENAESAIVREKQIKKWNRMWKLRLIEASNPEWLDLYAEIVGAGENTGFPPARE